MKREFLLCNFCNCRQHGIFQNIESALGFRRKVDDHYFKIESFAMSHGIAC